MRWCPRACARRFDHGLLDERDPALRLGEAVFVEVRARDVEEHFVEIGCRAERFERGARPLEASASARVVEREVGAETARALGDRVEEVAGRDAIGLVPARHEDDRAIGGVEVRGGDERSRRVCRASHRGFFRAAGAVEHRRREARFDVAPSVGGRERVGGVAENRRGVVAAREAIDDDVEEESVLEPVRAAAVDPKKPREERAVEHAIDVDLRDVARAQDGLFEAQTEERRVTEDALGVRFFFAEAAEEVRNSPREHGATRSRDELVDPRAFAEHETAIGRHEQAFVDPRAHRLDEHEGRFVELERERRRRRRARSIPPLRGARRAPTRRAAGASRTARRRARPRATTCARRGARPCRSGASRRRARVRVCRRAVARAAPSRRRATTRRRRARGKPGRRVKPRARPSPRCAPRLLVPHALPGREPLVDLREVDVRLRHARQPFPARLASVSSRLGSVTPRSRAMHARRPTFVFAIVLVEARGGAEHHAGALDLGEAVTQHARLALAGAARDDHPARSAARDDLVDERRDLRRLVAAPEERQRPQAVERDLRRRAGDARQRERKAARARGRSRDLVGRSDRRLARRAARRPTWRAIARRRTTAARMLAHDHARRDQRELAPHLAPRSAAVMRAFGSSSRPTRSRSADETAIPLRGTSGVDRRELPREHVGERAFGRVRLLRADAARRASRRSRRDPSTARSTRGRRAAPGAM